MEVLAADKRAGALVAPTRAVSHPHESSNHPHTVLAAHMRVLGRPHSSRRPHESSGRQQTLSIAQGEGFPAQHTHGTDH